MTRSVAFTSRNKLEQDQLSIRPVPFIKRKIVEAQWIPGDDDERKSSPECLWDSDEESRAYYDDADDADDADEKV